jgi:hypothetical protein
MDGSMNCAGKQPADGTDELDLPWLSREPEVPFYRVLRSGDRKLGLGELLIKRTGSAESGHR